MQPQEPISAFRKPARVVGVERFRFDAASKIQLSYALTALSAAVFVGVIVVEVAII